MPTMACSNMFLFAAAWMFLALSSSPASSWSCELRLVGGNENVDTLLEAQLKCLPEANDTGEPESQRGHQSHSVHHHI